MWKFNKLIKICTFLLLTTGLSGSFADLPCDNDIYCYGDILHTIQRGLFHNRSDTESKDFVDMQLKFEPAIVHSNFDFMIAQNGPNPPEEELQKFLEHNFGGPATEFEEWDPADWIENPEFLTGVSDLKLRTFGSELNAFWKVLGRKIKKDVDIRSEMYSMIYVANPLIVPGGRFREFYYWDQFWILKGLLHSEMTSTVKGMLENFMEMVNKIGFIPNGGRIYYRRSQPPLLIPMVLDYLGKTNDPTFLATNIATMDKEFQFWMNNRVVDLELNGKNFTVARFNVELGNPRPEAYNQDYDLVSELTSQVEQTELYMHLKTAAESGIDFSSRWYIPEDTSTVGTMLDTKTRFMLPVDLNVLIYRNAKIMAEFHQSLGNPEMAAYYQTKMVEWEEVIQEVFWNEEKGCWFDFDMVTNGGGHKLEFYPGNVLPLILNLDSTNEKVERVLNYLGEEGVLSYPGGIPSSLEPTGDQWDFPNAWAPHVHWFIESLEATGHPEALTVARETAQKWMTNNYYTYMTHNKTMFEKYDCQNAGAGGGGEYPTVIGFGWTNGVVLDLLNKYGDILVAPEVKNYYDSDSWF